MLSRDRTATLADIADAGATSTVIRTLTNGITTR
jgi:hypothetical protein